MTDFHSSVFLSNTNPCINTKIVFPGSKSIGHFIFPLSCSFMHGKCPVVVVKHPKCLKLGAHTSHFYHKGPLY